MQVEGEVRLLEDWFIFFGSLTNSVEVHIFSNLVHMLVLSAPSRAGHEFLMDASLGKDDRWHWGAFLSPRTEVQGYKIVDVISVSAKKFG
jgi:hypothetical protein